MNRFNLSKDMLSNDNAKIKDLKLQLERDINYFRTNPLSFHFF
jgi:hypothetical protein